MPTDYSAFGAIGGLLAPYLFKWLANPTKNADGTLSTSLFGGGNPLAGASPTTMAAASPAAAAKAPTNFTIPGQSPEAISSLGSLIGIEPSSLGYLGKDFTIPGQPASGSPASTDDIAAALAKMSSSSKPADATSNMPRPLGPTTISQPNYAGSGPTPGSLAAMNPQAMMMGMQLPNGGIGAPLGYAANNPLLALLKGRLGVV